MTRIVTSQPAKIGIVDDDLSVRRSVGRLLRSCGYTCKSYESAELALADPALQDMACLILDVQLPAVNGFGLRDQLQARGIRMPHMFITAHADPDSLEWTSQIGDSPFLRKPFESSQLIGLLELLLEGKAH